MDEIINTELEQAIEEIRKISSIEEMKNNNTLYVHLQNLDLYINKVGGSKKSL